MSLSNAEFMQCGLHYVKMEQQAFPTPEQSLL